MRQWIDGDVEVLMKEACTIQHQPRPAKQTAQLFAKLLMKGKVRATLWLISDRCMIKLLSNYRSGYTHVFLRCLFSMCVCVFYFQSSVLPYLTVTAVPVRASSSMSKRCCPPVPLLIVPPIMVSTELILPLLLPSCCPSCSRPWTEAIVSLIVPWHWSVCMGMSWHFMKHRYYRSVPHLICYHFKDQE